MKPESTVKENKSLSSKRTVSAASVKRIWSDKQFRLFLSHRAEVKKETVRLKEDMAIFGVSCFVAHEDIKPTIEWQNEIENALFSMDSLAALLTENFHESPWTNQEVGFAFGQDVPIISAKLGADPCGFMGKFQGLPVSWDDAGKELVKLLIKQDRMLNAFIHAVRNCNNYKDGNLLAEILPSIDKLSDQQADDLVDIYKENGQLQGSYGFNGDKPANFGKGLAYHLKRCNGRKLHLPESGQIEIT